MRCRLLLVATLLASLVLASPASAQSSTHAEASARSHRAQAALMGSGAAALGAGYLVTAVAGVFAGESFGLCLGSLGCGGGSGSNPAWESFRWFGLVPVVGPWLQLASQPTGFGDDSWGPFLIGVGLTQLAGAALLISGIVVHLEGDDADRASSAPTLQVSPIFDPGGGGIRLSGSF